MKILRFIFTVAVVVAIAVGGYYVYRGCSLKGCSASVLTAQAEQLQATGYSNVIDDLSVADNFDISLYPTVENDYSLKVIQIAESTEKELFVYVYQPIGVVKDIRATSVRISTAINDNAQWRDYPLTYLNSAETLYKYRVDDIKVKSDTVRYYDISAIHRKYIEGVDEKPDDDNTVNESACEAAQLWTVCTFNGNVTYEMQKTETVKITSKHVGFIRYSNGFALFKQSCDSHYVAFSTDYDIDLLMEADISYVYRSKSYTETSSGNTSPIRYGEYVTEPNKSLRYTDKVSNPAHGIGAHKYTWNRIESKDSFINNAGNKLTSETKAAIADTKWVLRFYESEYTRTAVVEGIGVTLGKYAVSCEEVTEVTILRLKFDMNGTVYNLGVVDNKQSGDDKPDNIEKKCGDDIIAFFTRIWNFIRKYWNWFLIGAIVVVCLAVCSWLLRLLLGK